MKKMNFFFLIVIIVITGTINLVAQPSMVADIHVGKESSMPSSFTIYKNQLYFSASESRDPKLWRYDGINPPVIVADIAAGFLFVFNDKLYFNASDTIHGGELWVYDGVSPPTMVADINKGIENGNPQYFFTYKNKLYFQADDGTHGIELWSYDGTNPPAMVADIWQGPNWGYCNAYPALFNNKMYFGGRDGTYRPWLWSYDGVNPPKIEFSNVWAPLHLTVFNNKLYFAASDSVNKSDGEIWVYDGIHRPVRATDINAGIDKGSYPEFLTVFKNKLYFRGSEESTGREVWSFDGVNPATITKDIYPGKTSTNLYPFTLTGYKDKLYFSANDSIHGEELWATDGINPPVLVADINSGTANGVFPYSFVFNNRLYFTADDGTHGYELWTLDIPTDIASAPDADLQIMYSNPCSGSIHVELKNFRGNVVHAEIYTSLGQLTTSNTFSNCQAFDMDIPGASGIYFIKISAEGQSKTVKLLKE